jgi:DNA end-binding protein Ku
MAARSIWKGSISFGLVQIPVALYPAECPKELSFHMLTKGDLSPIHFKRVNASTGEEVDYKDLVKGFKTKDGTWVVMTDADFARANVDATQSVDILDFIDAAELDPIYFDKPYYLAPVALRKGRPTESKAYVLLRETLRRTGKVGIAKVVIRTREHLAAVMPHENVLVLNLLRFDHEVRDADKLDIPDTNLKAANVSDREIKMAEQLVAEMSSKWDPKKYHDEYREDILALIRKRVKEGKAHEIDESEPEAPEPRDTEAVDMLSLLKKSLEQGGSKAAGRGRAANKNATTSKSGAKKKTAKSAKKSAIKRAA